MKMVEQVACINNRKTVSAEFLLLMCATCSTIFISKCKLKISNMPTQNASYTYKIIKINFKSYKR